MVRHLIRNKVYFRYKTIKCSYLPLVFSDSVFWLSFDTWLLIFKYATFFLNAQIAQVISVMQKGHAVHFHCLKLWYLGESACGSFDFEIAIVSWNCTLQVICYLSYWWSYSCIKFWLSSESHLPNLLIHAAKIICVCKWRLNQDFVQISTPVTPRQPTPLKTTNAVEIKAGIWCKYLSGNNLPRMKLIRGKLFPDRYLFPIILIPVAFVVFCRVGCLWITGVINWYPDWYQIRLTSVTVRGVDILHLLTTGLKCCVTFILLQ